MAICGDVKWYAILGVFCVHIRWFRARHVILFNGQVSVGVCNSNLDKSETSIECLR